MATYLKYDIVSKTLKNHRYRFDHEKVSQGPDIIDENPLKNEVKTPLCNEEFSATSSDKASTFQKKAINKIPRKARLSLFEESQDKDNIQKKIESVINEDHYYDELLPYDYGRTFLKPIKKKLPLTAIIVFFAAFIAITLLLIIYLKKFL